VISAELSSLVHADRQMATETLGIIDSKQLSDAIKRAALGQEVPVVHLLRTIAIEVWLKRLPISKALAETAEMLTGMMTVGPGSTLTEKPIV